MFNNKFQEKPPNQFEDHFIARFWKFQRQLHQTGFWEQISEFKFRIIHN